MKFRLLNEEERKVFDEDFKHFLIANGVSNEEWTKLNEDKSEKAMQLVALFSDTVFQKVTEKMQYIEMRSKENLLVFSCEKDKMNLIGFTVKPGVVDVTLETSESIHNAIVKHATDLQIFKQEKAYSKEREIEIFEMLENGCIPSHKDFWNMLNKAIQ